MALRQPHEHISVPDTISGTRQTHAVGLATFVWDWYICIKTGSSIAIKSTPILQQLVKFNEGLQAELGDHESQFWPVHMTDNSGSRCWLIGIPNLTSSELRGCRKYMKNWVDEMTESALLGKLEGKFIPRKVFIERQFRPADEQTAIETGHAVEAQTGSIATGSTFQKRPGSNPKEVRRQFLDHAMGASQSSSSSPASQPTVKLKPVKQILNRLRFDAQYVAKNYVVGYIDRTAGILVKGVHEWKEYDEEELIAYVKNVETGVVVWDRVRKVDLISGAK